MTKITTEVEKPIVVPASAIPANVMTLVQYALVAVGGTFVSKGYISDNTLNDVVGIILMLLPAAYGIYKTQHNHDVKVKMADKLPDSIAKVEK